MDIANFRMPTFVLFRTKSLCTFNTKNKFYNSPQRFGNFFYYNGHLPSPYLSHIFLIPVMINPIEIIHNHAVGGKIKISNMPIPAPNIQPAIIFLHFLKNISFPPYYILWETLNLCEGHLY